MPSGRKCTICTNRNRERIDKDVVSMRTSMRAIAIKYRVGLASLVRHRDRHLARELVRALHPDIAEAVERNRVNDLASFYDQTQAKLAHVDREVEEILAEAKQAKDYPTALQACRQLISIRGELRNTRELLAKGRGELSPEPDRTVNNFVICLPDADADVASDPIDVTAIEGEAS